MLDIIADYLSMRDMKFVRLDGRMGLEKRAVEMETFRNDPDTYVFLISTRAGGLGVNLTAADTVIIYDSDWVCTEKCIDHKGILKTVCKHFSLDRIHNVTYKLKIDVIVSVRRSQ